MLADILQEILSSAANAEYRNNGEPIKLVIALDNGTVYRGHLVSPEEWLEINSVDGRTGQGWVGGRERAVPGSWPKTFTDPKVQERIKQTAQVASRDGNDGTTYTMIFMTMVEFLSGDHWVSGSSMATETNKVIACGEQYH